MLEAGDKKDAHRTMLLMKGAKRRDGAEMYEAGRPLLADEYAAQEAMLADGDGGERERRAQETLKEFLLMLEPEPGMYIQGVFAFYNGHVSELDALIAPKDRARLISLIKETAFAHMDPADSTLTIDAEGPGNSYTTTVAVGIFREALVAAKHLGIDIDDFRRQILNYIPFAYHDELAVIFELIKEIHPGELAPVIDIYESRSSDLWRHNPSSFIRAVEQYHVVDAVPVLRALAFEPRWRPYQRDEAVTVATSLSPEAAFLNEVFSRYMASEDAEERQIAETANGLLISVFADRVAITWRLEEIVKRSQPFVERPSGRRMSAVGPVESEIRFQKTFAKPLMNFKDPEFQDSYLDLVDSALEIWAKGESFQPYASYLWDIVSAYFDNLKELRSYAPLRALERKINESRNREGANWLANRIARIRHAYISYLGRPDNIAKAIAKHNACLEHSADRIRNEDELFERVKAVIQEDISRWIHEEGAYKTLAKKLPEEHVQITLKAPIELALYKRGFQVEVLRESQLLDGKRTDFLVRYGFAGPIVLEVKLTSNKDIRGNSIEGSKSYESMKRYMSGYGARHGIFLIIDNANANNLGTVIEAYQKIEGVTAIPISCNFKKKAKRRNPRTTRPIRR